MLNIEKLIADASTIRKLLLGLCAGKEGGHHFGGSLSTIELLVYIYGYFLNISKKNVFAINRDRFILSKGHGVLGFYSALYFYNFISKKDFLSYKTLGSEFIAHPIKNLNHGIESSNGSLGHGLSYGSGIAYGARLLDNDSKVVVLMGDGECNEGSVWEAIMSSTSLKLDNLYIIIDYNKFQSDGETKEIIDQTNLAERLESFGCAVSNIDGHDFSQIHHSFQKNTSGKPTAVIANTIKGKGVSFMENNNEWHHSYLTQSQYSIAMEHIDG